MGNQILTLMHFKDIDTSFQGRTIFILPDFLKPSNEDTPHPVVLTADNMLTELNTEYDPERLPPLINDTIQNEITQRIQEAKRDIDTAKEMYSALQLQLPLPEKSITTNILLRPVTLKVDLYNNGKFVAPDVLMSFCEVWNGYNQINAIKKIANTTMGQYETLAFIVGIINGLPIDNEGNNQLIAKTAFDVVADKLIIT